MGASLLDDILAETLDPAYAQAASSRARAADPSAQAAGRSSSPRWRAQVLVALTMVVAGLLVAVTYDVTAAKSQGRQQVRSALIDDIHGASTVTDDLAAELEDLRAQVSDTRERLLKATTVGQRALDELARAEQGAAAVPVSGPGLLVTLANAHPTADQDPVGGTAEDNSRGRVQDGDLQLVVNALWAAGAEAIGINGQRLGPTSAIRFAGEAVLVDFRPVTNPYEISAIGDPKAVSGAFLANRDVIELAGLSDVLEFRFDFAEADELRLPAAGTPELRAAQAEQAQPATPKSSAPGSSAPGPSAPGSSAPRTSGSTPPTSDEPPGGAP
ncbi:MAG: hypothetical protein JWQ99_385 [Blastococcus sp.]|jgi:uncharacterized protein YlxW (UPF0749 family)|nr:hypothetical protein [Blastococcus sp.]